MIRDKYKIYGEMNDPNTVTVVDELPNNAIVLGAGNKTIKAVTSFPKATDGLLIQQNSLNVLLTDGFTVSRKLVGEPATITFCILEQLFEIEVPDVPPVNDSTTINTITETVYPVIANDYYKVTITLDVYRRYELGENVPYCNITVAVKTSSDVSYTSNISGSYAFNYYCPITFGS